MRTQGSENIDYFRPRWRCYGISFCGGLLVVFNYIWIGPSDTALLLASAAAAAGAAVRSARSCGKSPTVPLMSNSLYVSRNRRLYRL